MRTDIRSQNLTDIRSQRNALLMVTCLLAANSVLLTGGLLFSSEKVIVLPPEPRQEFWIKGGKVSKEYLEDMGWGLSKLLLDLSPSTYVYNHEKLLTFTAPESYGRLKRTLAKEGESYKDLQLATHFYPSEITANPETLSVKVKGILSSFVGGKFVRSSEEVLEFKFSHRGGSFLLESITGAPSHTAGEEASHGS